MAGVTRAAGVVAVASLLVACAESNRADDRPATSGTADTERSTSSTEVDRETAVVAAYEEATEARTAALAPPVPDASAPALEETHTGPMLEQVRGVARGLRAQGLAIRYPADSERRIEVESVEFDSEDVAVLEVCAVDDGERIVVETGEVLADGVWSGRITAAMRQVDGRWKLAESEQGEQEQGATACVPAD